MAHWIFTEEHTMFRKAVRKFMLKEVSPQIEYWEQSETIPRSFFTRLGELGYLGISQTEEYGGVNLDTITEAVLIEELVKAGAIGPALAVLNHLRALLFIKDYGSDEIKEQLLSKGVAGELIFTTASFTKKADTLSVKKRNNSYWLEGQVDAFLGETADYTVVQVKTEDKSGHSLFLVDLKAEGIQCTSGKKKLGWRSLELNKLSLVNVNVPTLSLLGIEGHGGDYIEEVSSLQYTMTAVCCIRLAENALDSAKKYSQERVQFGKPIASFQALRHMMADMAIAIEKSRGITYRSLYLLCKKDKSPSLLAIKTIALKNSIEMVNGVCDNALQIHGGAGYMMEFPVQRYWRDGKMFSVFHREELRDNSSLVNWLNHSKGGQELAEKKQYYKH